MNNIRLVLLLAILMFTQMALASTCIQSSLSVTVEKVSGPIAYFKIQNEGAKSVHIHESTFPWEVRDSISFRMFDISSRNELESSLPPEDSFQPRDFHELRPSAAMKGSVDLRNHNAHLINNLRRSAVLVVWFYEPIGRNAQSLGKCAGSFILPRVEK